MAGLLCTGPTQSGAQASDRPVPLSRARVAHLGPGGEQAPAHVLPPSTDTPMKQPRQVPLACHEIGQGPGERGAARLGLALTPVERALNNRFKGMAEAIGAVGIRWACGLGRGGQI
jgi:hypothetical protein